MYLLHRRCYTIIMKVSDKTGQRDEAFELCDGWGKFECSGLSNQWKQSIHHWYAENTGWYDFYLFEYLL